MSRRGRHGRHGHPTALRPAAPGTAGPAPERAPGAVDARPADARPDRAASRRIPTRRATRLAASRPPTEALPRPGVAHVHGGNGTQPGPVPSTVAIAPVPEPAGQPGGFDGPRSTCTTAQLRRFIKSRPWVPMHELRRRFGIWGADDDVSPMRVGDTDAVHRPAGDGEPDDGRAAVRRRRRLRALARSRAHRSSSGSTRCGRCRAPERAPTERGGCAGVAQATHFEWCVQATPRNHGDLDTDQGV